jgi:phosphate transport system permease protein
MSGSPPAPVAARAVTAKGRAGGSRRDRMGAALTSLCGGALGFNLLLVVGLLGLIGYHGLKYFWQKPVVRLELSDGRVLMGEVHDREEAPGVATPGAAAASRLQLRVGNRDLVPADFVWLDESEIVARTTPIDAVVLERLEWGNLYGFFAELREGDQVIAAGSAAVAAALPARLAESLRQRRAARELEKGPIGDINAKIEDLRLERRRLALRYGDATANPDRRDREQALDRETAAREAEYEKLSARLFALREELQQTVLVMTTAAGEAKEIAVANIARAIPANALGAGGKWRLYGSRVWEFVAGEPRESNTEGGIFPAIFGTIMMVFLMSFAVAPLGVLAALYLREYAKQGPLVRAVRIAVNNLAGVPSIVFGVFGLGFFVYMVGGSIDQLLFPEALPTPTFGTGGILWAALTLALLTVPVVIVATEEGLAAVPRVVREGSLALGATKFETIRRVVIPAAAPGILTGLILAMARAAGEVAPLMIVGMVKLAPTLPVDHHFPFVHFERKFMHLGFHIYDVGFQSPNVDATKPLVFATALLLILSVTLLNLVAISLRNHLRRKYAGSAV